VTVNSGKKSGASSFAACVANSGAWSGRGRGRSTVRGFPFLQEPDTTLTRELANTAMWWIDTTWIRLIDNRIGFGHKDEWTPPAAGPS